MNEKSNPMPMMYKTIPAVAELNKVPGFDPLKFLRHKVSRKTNEEMLQLELPYQKLWFRLRHPQGRMKLTTLRITEQLAIMEARVYLDRSDAEPISSYISQHSAEEGTDYVQAAQDEALSAALSDAGFGLQFADVAVDSTGKVFGSSIPLSGAASIQQPMPDAAQRPVEASGAALRQSGGEVHARLERAPQSVVERRNAPARPTSIQKPAAKPVQNEQPPVSPVQPTVQQMAAEEKENMDTLPVGKVEENAPNMELPVPNREVTLDKAQKSIRRFSEDIDLTVCIDNCSNSQAKKRLEMATKKYQALPRTSRKDLEDDRKGSITTVYDYTPLVGVDSDDPLQRFGYVKVEGTSFTVSEPFTPLEIEPILYTYATEEQRNILQSQYNVAPFMINTIRLERIFADKIFAAEFYYERKMYFDVAKHLYDVSVMFDLEQIQEMIQNQQTFLEMLGYKRLEETRRTGSDLAEKKFSDFQLLRGFSDNEALRKDYQNMQRNYVFAEEDALSFGFVVEQWKKLGEVLLALE